MTNRFTSWAVLGAIAWLTTYPCISTAAEVTVEIQAQPLKAALQEFGTQTGVQVMYRTEEVATQGVMAPKVSGRLSAEEALTRLLSASRLRYEFVNATTVRIWDPEENEKITSDAGIASGSDLQVAQASGSSSEGGAPVGEPTDVSDKSLEEVVVTAQKRQERLQDVPISISVLSGSELDKFTGDGVSDALTLVPGIKMTQDGLVAGTQLGLRGVAASGAFINGSSPVAYYIDSVPFGFVKTAIVPDSNAYDLERIEVLRGPQSTLYGANALNGVVRVLTQDADPSAFSFKARTSVSNTDRGRESYRGDLAVNVPLIEGKLAARAVLGYQDLGGWIDLPNSKDGNDAEVKNLRLKVNAQPTDKLSVGLSAWRSRAEYGGLPTSDNEDNFPGALGQPMSADYDILGLKIAYEFPGFSLSSMTSHIDYSNAATVDFSTFALDLFFTGLDSKVLSQEFLLNSANPESAWRWTAGAFYRDAEDRLLQTWFLFAAPFDFSDTSESFSVFGELTRKFLDGRFELTGGLRYFEDEVGQVENAPLTGVPGDPLYRASDTFDTISPRLALTWHPSDRSTIYASYSEGFRSGYNQSAAVPAELNAPPVKEDKLKNYELGAKGSLWNGQVNYDTALYFIDWQDVQQTLTSGPTFIVVAANGEAASGVGLDLGVTARPVGGLELGASFSWNDLTLDAPVPVGGGSEFLLFEKGDRLNYSSEYTAGASVGYVFPLGAAGLEGRVEGSANYSSEQATRRFAGQSVAINPGDSTVIGRARFSISSPNSWTVSIFADNVGNERGAPVRAVPDYYSIRIRPRTIGVQFEYAFDRQ